MTFGGRPSACFQRKPKRVSSCIKIVKENFTKMAMKAGDKHWKNTQQIKMEF